MKKLVFLTYMILGFSCCISNISVCFASNETQKTQESIMPIGTEKTEFTAGMAECQQSKDESNICVYSDHAIFTSGKKKLWAPTITVYRNSQNEITKIVAIADKKGNKAYYQGELNAEENSKSNQPKPQINAHANKITIYVKNNLMDLEDEAYAVKNHEVITGDYLEYDMQKQTIFAKPIQQDGITTILFNQKNLHINKQNLEQNLATSTENDLDIQQKLDKELQQDLNFQQHINSNLNQAQKQQSEQKTEIEQQSSEEPAKNSIQESAQVQVQDQSFDNSTSNKQELKI